MVFSAPTHAAAAEFRNSVTAWTQDFERKYSRFRPDSIISRINTSAGVAPVPIDAELAGIFKLCDWFHWMTAGIFDPTLLPLLWLWDYHAERPVVPASDRIAAAKELVGWKLVEHDASRVFLPHPGMGLDIGGIGKEYAVDRVVEMAMERGIENIMVDFGRDIRARGQPPEGGPWRIGLEDPDDPGQCWCGIALPDRAVATSGDYARHFVVDGRRYGHILDPRTGCPVENDSLAVSVVAATCTEAGILSTSAFVLGLQEGGALLDRCHQASGCILARRGTFRSRDFDRYVISKHIEEPVRTPQEVAL
jgi:thiamine biosynthesis lipoprotein